MARGRRPAGRLYAELGGVGDFRRGTLSAVFRKCGKPNCRCAQPGDPGHGPQYNLTRWAAAANGSANAWPSWTSATPGRSSPRAVTCGSAARWPASATGALHYFETNAHRMHYAWYRSLGLFIGSGVVEAGCKSVIPTLLSHTPGPPG